MVLFTWIAMQKRYRTMGRGWMCIRRARNANQVSSVRTPKGHIDMCAQKREGDAVEEGMYTKSTVI